MVAGSSNDEDASAEFSLPLREIYAVKAREEVIGVDD